MRICSLGLLIILVCSACGSRTSHGSRQVVDVSCLPALATEISGKYLGEIKGDWVCPGKKPTEVVGKVEIELTQTDLTEFKITGSVTGSSLVPMTGSITGMLLCDQFSGKLPELLAVDISASSKLSGEMNGQLNVNNRIEITGSWQAQENVSTCKVSGNWSAYK